MLRIPHDNDDEDDDDDVGHAMNKKPFARCRKRPVVDDAEGDAVKRDRNKNYHFQNQLKKLPDYVQTMYANGTCREKSVLINTIMEPGDGPHNMVAKWEGKYMFEDLRAFCVVCRFVLHSCIHLCHAPVNIHL